MYTSKEYAEMAARANREGKILWVDTDGNLHLTNPPEPPLSEARAAKYAEVIAKANAAKAMLSADFSTIEIDTWPTQEAGARAITGTEADVKNEAATLILMSEAATARAVERVKSLAEIDGAAPGDFALRIIGHADQAYMLGNLTLNEQRGYESVIKAIMAGDETEYPADADRIAALEAINVRYTVLEEGNG